MGRLTIEAGPVSVEQYGKLESGDILYFPVNPIPLPAEDRAFLLGQRRESRFHKHISYRPAEDRLKGIGPKDEASRTHQIMSDYSRNAIGFMASLLPRYARDWKIDLASFRPFEEQGRNLRVRARNDLIHVDNFPSRPSRGDCLLRIFTNINPERPRIWVTSESFEPLAWKHAAKAGLPRPRTPLDALRGHVKGLLAGLGLPVVQRPPYDEFMLRFHHYMKQNREFQRDCPKDRWEFPPLSTWICFTDTTSHSCLSGQFALEQTFIVRRESLIHPEKAPIAVLERISGLRLTA